MKTLLVKVLISLWHNSDEVSTITGGAFSQPFVQVDLNAVPFGTMGTVFPSNY